MDVTVIKESDTLDGHSNWRFSWADQSCLTYMADDEVSTFTTNLHTQVNESNTQDVLAWIESQGLVPAV